MQAEWSSTLSVAFPRVTHERTCSGLSQGVGPDQANDKWLVPVRLETIVGHEASAALRQRPEHQIGFSVIMFADQ
jgi:hypothetical protein